MAIKNFKDVEVFCVGDEIIGRDGDSYFIKNTVLNKRHDEPSLVVKHDGQLMMISEENLNLLLADLAERYDDEPALIVCDACGKLITITDYDEDRHGPLPLDWCKCTMRSGKTYKEQPEDRTQRSQSNEDHS